VLDDGVGLIRIPSLDLYREPDPFRVPRPGEYRDWIDVLEVATMMTAGFPEPMTFSLRALRELSARRDRYDVVHDNQSLGYGLLGLARLGLPLVTTVHHPVQIDRRLELAAAVGFRRLSLRRWYGFTRMQRRVAKHLRHVITVSESSRAEITEQLRIPAERIRVVGVGADVGVFHPDPSVPRVPDRIVTTASADVPLKGLLPLVEAVAKVRTERPAELVVVGSARRGGPVAEAISRYDLHDAVRFTGRLTEAELATELRRAALVVVPSLFEGFSLPLVEAMACGTPVVATTGGALPEVAGRHGETALLVPPGDPQALADAIVLMLADDALRARLGTAGRERVLRRFTWRAAAERTVECYRDAIGREPAC
jgi:glycosyltransferase involved in cell wall biosynthesis